VSILHCITVDVRREASLDPHVCLVRPQLGSGGAGAGSFFSKPLPCDLRTEQRVCGTLLQDRTRQESSIERHRDVLERVLK
jgi:hypothetical protein